MGQRYPRLECQQWAECKVSERTLPAAHRALPKRLPSPRTAPPHPTRSPAGSSTHTAPRPQTRSAPRTRRGNRPARPGPGAVRGWLPPPLRNGPSQRLPAHGPSGPPPPGAHSPPPVRRSQPDSPPAGPGQSDPVPSHPAPSRHRGGPRRRQAPHPERPHYRAEAGAPAEGRGGGGRRRLPPPRRTASRAPLRAATWRLTCRQRRWGRGQPQDGCPASPWRRVASPAGAAAEASVGRTGPPALLGPGLWASRPPRKPRAVRPWVSRVAAFLGLFRAEPALIRGTKGVWNHALPISPSVLSTRRLYLRHARLETNVYKQIMWPAHYRWGNKVIKLLFRQMGWCFDLVLVQYSNSSAVPMS